MLNGKLLCQATPCSKSIDLGNHQVSIQKERYFPWEQTISALSSRTVHAELKPEFGYLEIQADVSGVHIELDGKSLGKTPIALLEVEAGIHNISIQDPCYQSQPYRYQAQAGEREVVPFSG